MTAAAALALAALAALALAALALFLAGAAPAAASPPADLLLLHVTARDPALDLPAPDRAIAVRAGRIAAIVPAAEADAYRGPATIVLDLPGTTVVPGLVDAHAHLASFGASLERLDLTGTRSPAEIASRVAERARTTPPGAWILGRGWDQNDWPAPDRTFPGRAVLDAAAPGHPVLLTRVDGHAVWANGRALALAHIDAGTRDPEGGEILRAPDGAPAGVLVDRATDLIEAAVPAPTPADTRRHLVAAMAAANAAGLTGVHDASIDRATIQVYRQLAGEEKLTLRVYAMVNADEAALDSILAAGPLFEGLFTLRCVKIIADGAMGSRGALLLEDYADRPGHRGLAVTPAGRIEDIAARSLGRGFQVATHAIGDAAIRMTLDAYATAIGPTDALIPPARGPRLRIEHLQRIDPADLPRLAALGVVASMQPTHATSDMPWVEERLGRARLAGAYAWRTVLAAGINLALGSDFPVESHRPLLGLYAAITRQDAAGQPDGGWIPEEKLTPREALAGATLGAAFAAFAEAENGRLLPGCRADLTVLRLDPVTSPPANLLDENAIAATIVDGKVAFQHP